MLSDLLSSDSRRGRECLGIGNFFFFKQKTAYEIGVRLVGSEMCIRDRDELALMYI